MIRTRILPAAVLTSLTLAFAPVGAGDTTAVDAPDAVVGQSVVSLIDTGINPYHVEFRDDSPLAQQHPSTYIEGYPADTPALHLSLDAGSYEEATGLDCEIWRTVEKGKLYWIPGTKIIGAASFQNASAACSPISVLSGEVHILDQGGHGTMTASRAAANTFGACPLCRIVAIEYTGSVNLIGPGGSEDGPVDAVRLAAEHADWIDVQSNSWGPIVPVYDPTSATGLLSSNPGFIRAVEEVSATMPAFWASGNGAAFRGGALGHPSFLNPSATPSAIQVGGHDSGYVTVWPGFPPHLVSDACDSWAALPETMDASGDSVGGGTSGATPFVAGNATRLIGQARALLGDSSTGQTDGVFATGDPGDITEGPLADGVFTRAELQRLLYVTASDRPKAQHEDGPPCGVLGAPYNEIPVRWVDVPAGVPEYLNIGYGAVDNQAMALAGEVLRGEVASPARPSTDLYFSVHHGVGDVTHQAYTAAP